MKTGFGAWQPWIGTLLHRQITGPERDERLSVAWMLPFHLHLHGLFPRVVVVMMMTSKSCLWFRIELTLVHVPLASEFIVGKETLFFLVFFDTLNPVFLDVPWSSDMHFVRVGDQVDAWL